MEKDNHTRDEQSRRNEAMGQLLAELLDEDLDLGGRQTRRLPIGAMMRSLWQHRRLYYRVLPLTFAVAAVLTLSLPDYYQCTVMLAPELSGGAKGSGGLASLASNFGISLGGSGGQADALMPTLYPDLMNSVSFRTSLFPVKVQCPTDDNGVRRETTYYDYLENEQRKPWWSAAVGWTVKAAASLFKDDEAEEKTVNPFRLTRDQFAVMETMAKKVVCDVDAKTLVITINVTDQDALICATMADSVQQHLQAFITDYRTRKARVDVEHYTKLFAEARQDYEQALARSARYADANQHTILQRVQSEATKLQNEVSLQYQAYSQIAAQLKLAEAKVQEDTPAFTVLQPATVPVKKAGPKRPVICLALLFLAFLATSGWVFWKDRERLFEKEASD